MKRKLALFMAAVMLLTTPGSISFASDVSDEIIVEEEPVDTEAVQDDGAETVILKDSQAETEPSTQNEELLIVDTEDETETEIYENIDGEEQESENEGVLSEEDEVSIIDVTIVNLNLCGTWEGTYTGSSSGTNVERTIKLNIDYCDSESIFEGTAEIDNGDKGLYFFTGTINYDTREITFEGDEWLISTDSSFSFTSFSGTLSEDFTIMQGIVSSDSSRTFSIEKTSDSYSTTRIDMDSVPLDWTGEYDGHHTSNGVTVVVRRNYEFHIQSIDASGTISGTAIISPSDKADSSYGANGSYLFSGSIDYRTGKIFMQGYEWTDYPEEYDNFTFVELK